MNRSKRSGNGGSVRNAVVLGVAVLVGAGSLALIDRVWAQPASKKLEAMIVVDASRPGAKVSPLLYGTNVNFPGLVNGFSNEVKTQAEHDSAIQKWFANIPLIANCGPTIIRFPGGLNANHYVWTYGIGPMGDRIQRSFGWNGYSTIGTDEFLTFCEKLHSQAMITVNINRASGASPLTAMTAGNWEKNAGIAADWVEYCNAPNNGSNPRGGTDWAAVRARNGHPEPYGVKYWELGNELWDMPLDSYTQAVRIFSKAMKAADPAIQIGAITLHPNLSPPEKYEPWLKTLLAQAGGSFDFWIHHAYTPGVSPKTNGFVLFGGGSSVTTKVSFPRPGSCSLCYTAGPVKGAAKVVLFLDGRPIDSSTVLFPKEYCAKFQAPQGDHILKLTLESGNGVQIFHMMKRTDASGSSYVDFKNSPEIYYLIVAGAGQDEKTLWPDSLLGGKPVHITEYNSHYDLAKRPPMLGQVYSLREALNIAQYLQFFARKGFASAEQWLLYDDMYGFGLIGGVGFDPNRGGAIGRDKPTPRPSYHILKLYREHLEGKLLPVEVRGPQFHVGPPAPCAAMGFVGGSPMDVPFINAVASISDDGKRLSVLVNNLHFDEEFTCKVRVSGFIPGPRARYFVVTGPDSWANNEPDTCPTGECVRLTETGVPISGPEFSLTLPPHSASAVVLSR